MSAVTITGQASPPGRLLTKDEKSTNGTYAASMSDMSQQYLEIVNTDGAGTATLALFGRIGANRYAMRWQDQTIATPVAGIGTIALTGGQKLWIKLLSWYPAIDVDVSSSASFGVDSNANIKMALHGLPV